MGVHVYSHQRFGLCFTPPPSGFDGCNFVASQGCFSRSQGLLPSTEQRGTATNTLERNQSANDHHGLFSSALCR